MKGDRLPNASERWFRLLLRLYPADFRDEMGEALVETYLHRSREESLAVVWCAALWDSLRNGLGERVSPAVAWRRAGNWGRDMELVSRRLRQKPMFVAAVLGTLTIALGTFAVVYTAVDKILLEALPYPNPDDLYMVWHKGGEEGDHFPLTGPAVADLQKAGGVIEAAAGMQFGGATLPAGPNTDASAIRFLSSTPGLLDLLGVRPALGRGFRPEDASRNAPYVAVLSDGLWKRLGGDPAIIGTEFKASSLSFMVIGVMPPDFEFNSNRSTVKPDMYLPFLENLAAESPEAHDFMALIRARRGASADDVRQALGSLSRFIEERDKAHTDLHAIGLQADIVREVRPALVALTFAVVFLVLVLTMNLASLLLARAAEREREFAVSRALGGSGSAVVRATLIEGAFLGFIGSAAGALAAVWSTRLLITQAPANLPHREALALDWGIALVVVSLGVLLGLTAAAVPAAWASRVSLASLVSASAVRGGAGPSRMRRGLVVVQVALSLVLLSAGGLVVRSFERLVAADPGFKSAGVLTMVVGLPDWVFPKAADAFAFQDRTFAAIRALPGVTGVSAATNLPLSGGAQFTTMSIPGAPGNNGEEDHDNLLIDRIFIRAGYVEAMGMRLLEGRAFENRREGVREALIDRHLAKHFFPNGSPLGATVECNGVSMTIVGVVEQSRLYDLHQDGRPQLFVRADDHDRRPGALVVRTDRADPKALIPEVRTVIRQLEPRIAVTTERTMDEIVAARRSRERISAVMISGLALGALILVAMGLFGVISGSVARRRGELAVRMALGATHGRVIRLVVGEGARLVALGVLIGIPGVDMAGEAIQGLLIDVSPFDVPTIITVTMGLIVIALLACYFAARRVTAIEPERLLREG